MSLLLRRMGPRVILEFFPEVDGTDADGTPIRKPGDFPVRVAGFIAPFGKAFEDTENTTTGQDITTRYRFWAKRIPPGAFSHVRYDGRDWDVVGEPKRYRGVQQILTHDVIQIRARSPEPLVDEPPII